MLFKLMRALVLLTLNGSRVLGQNQIPQTPAYKPHSFAPFAKTAGHYAVHLHKLTLFSDNFSLYRPM